MQEDVRGAHEGPHERRPELDASPQTARQPTCPAKLVLAMGTSVAWTRRDVSS